MDSGALARLKARSGLFAHCTARVKVSLSEIEFLLLLEMAKLIQGKGFWSKNLTIILQKL